MTRLNVYGRYTQDALTLWNPYGGTALTTVTTGFPGLAVTNGIRPGRNIVVNGTHMSRPTLISAVPIYAGLAPHRLPSPSIANRKKLGLTLPELFPENSGDVIPNHPRFGICSLAPYPRAAKGLFNVEFTDNVAKIFHRQCWSAASTTRSAATWSSRAM